MSEIGENEFAARQADIAEVKARTMTLETAQKRARKRQRESCLTPSAFYLELTKATGSARTAVTSTERGAK